MQTQFVQKLKASLKETQEMHNVTVRERKGFTSQGMETAYDMRTFCAPFDLKAIDKEMKI